MNVAGAAVNVLSLCSGYGGLDLGVRLALPCARTVCYVEREAYLAGLLQARMEDGALDRAPVWSDLATFDGIPWRGCVELVTAGFPCQPHSVAGRRGGVEDERWLWPEIARIVREVGCRCVYLENVPGLLTSGGFGAVLGDLAALGFHAEWTCVSAASVGASHQRERLFLLAVSERAERGALGGRRNGGGEGIDARGEAHRGPGEPDAPLADAGLPLFPPGPGERDAWERVLADRPDLAPAQPVVRGVADGGARRVDRLRALGNGVVPLQAADAFRLLWERLGEASFPEAEAGLTRPRSHSESFAALLSVR